MSGYPSYPRYPAWERPSGVWNASASPGPAHVRVVTDSAADLLPSHARAIGVVVVPSRVILDGTAYYDGVDLTRAQFYALLPRLDALPYTLPPSANDFHTAYQIALRQGASGIVSIHVSGRLSENVHHATLASDSLAPAPIDVIDSGQTGIGMWPAVIRAAQLARAGEPIHVIHEAVGSILARTRLYAMVESLEPLRRAGRIGRARELVGTLLDAHPILTVEQGEVAPVDTVRPRARGLLRLRELAQAVGPIELLLICGTSIEAIGQFEAVLAEQYEGTIQKTWLGPTNSANTGPCLAVAVVAALIPH